jgi:hypothetical protein
MVSMSPSESRVWVLIPALLTSRVTSCAACTTVAMEAASVTSSRSGTTPGRSIDCGSRAVA